MTTTPVPVALAALIEPLVAGSRFGGLAPRG